MTTTNPTSTDTGPALRLLSLGAGVQSTTVLLLACEGEIPHFDVALFADTGWEPRAVYANLDRLTVHAEQHGIPVRRVSAGNIRADALDPKHRFVSMPLHTLNPDGSRGLARRQCTSEYKITPLKKAARELLGYPHPRRVPRGVYAEQAIGISTDEFHRAKDSGLRFLRNVFPLIDLGFDRTRCVEYLAERGFGETVKSACVGCPFHGNAGWRWVRDHDPQGWVEAVEFDRAIRHGYPRGEHVDRLLVAGVDRGPAPPARGALWQHGYDSPEPPDQPRLRGERAALGQQQAEGVGPAPPARGAHLLNCDFSARSIV